MPFVRMFTSGKEMTGQCTTSSKEQGDPLMPLLFALGKHAADDRLMAFLEDVYVVTFPDTLRDGHGSVQQESWTHSRSHPRRKNSSVEFGRRTCGILCVAQVTDPEARVWRDANQ